MNQRWLERRAIFRKPGEQIVPSEYDVVSIADDTTAKAFVLTHHYSVCYPAARFRFGLYRHGELVGVSVFSHPTNNRVLTNVFGGVATDSVELGRFVLLDEVPGNGETWFLARCFRLLKQEGLQGVVSFSDPVPRTTREGKSIFLGHVGTIYQAFNGVYLGRGTRRTLSILPDGSVFSDRTVQKIHKREKGWAYASQQLEKFGADPLGINDPREWLLRWLPVVTRKLRHAGNHRYAWSFGRQQLKSIAPFPKQVDA